MNGSQVTKKKLDAGFSQATAAAEGGFKNLEALKLKLVCNYANQVCHMGPGSRYLVYTTIFWSDMQYIELRDGIQKKRSFPDYLGILIFLGAT